MKGNQALHGFAAYNIFLSEYNKIMNLPPFDASIFNETQITVKFPKLIDQKLQIASSNVKKFIGNAESVKSYVSYMEFRPILHEFDDYSVYSVENQLLSITEFNGYKVVNIQYLLMDFLYKYFTSENEIKELYYNLYANTLKMIIDLTERKEENNGVFKLLDTTMGCKNYNQAYTARFKGNADRISKGLNALSEAEYINNENASLALLD